MLKEEDYHAFYFGTFDRSNVRYCHLERGSEPCDWICNRVGDSIQLFQINEGKSQMGSDISCFLMVTFIIWLSYQPCLLLLLYFILVRMLSDLVSINRVISSVSYHMMVGNIWSHFFSVRKDCIPSFISTQNLTYWKKFTVEIKKLNCSRCLCIKLGTRHRNQRIHVVPSRNKQIFLVKLYREEFERERGGMVLVPPHLIYPVINVEMTYVNVYK